MDQDASEVAGVSPAPCRVLVCDDQRAVREVVAHVLANDPRFEVVPPAEDGPGCLAGVADSTPDLLILDINMSGGGPHIVRAVKAIAPSLYVLVYSGRRDADAQQEMLAAGADRLLAKTGRIRPLLEAMDEAYRQIRPAAG